MTENLTNAEKRALEAANLEAFPVQLHEIRRTVKHVLSLFGRNNFFPEYTVHSYDHVHAMLEDLDWIIPDQSKEAMTSADWLMITLSTYFHDLGLIVTEEEYKNRSASQFKDFCSKILFGRDDGADYKQKVDTLGHDLAERFYYSEFVRYNHAARVKNWIQGSASTELGKSDTSASELGSLLSRLSDDFKYDLGNICESHNLDDLQDARKYKTFQPYGRSNDESCNLLYVAVLLRTTDLLQITKQRAPSVLHRFISPTDPLSQVEWAKQNSVRGIFPKTILDSEDVATGEQSDTISVYAKFNNENGFFGLTSYLRYARSELRKSHGFISKSSQSLSRKYVFPWKDIDDSQVEADGFIPHPFEFKIDQAKILDLLTGHTLYNDSSVAVRELIQNAIDAVRLQFHIDQKSSSEYGQIKINWDSKNLELSILDNGTGMTQDVIERHLLNVGSSRYQEPKFKEMYPSFSPISRFGIGVLSAFMVADSVRIVTVHPSEELGRQISLRSVHGKYLIRLLNKENDKEAHSIGKHGTLVTVRMRPSSKRINIRETIKQWIVFPRCVLTLQIDDGQPETIGFDSPSDAIQEYIDHDPEAQGIGADPVVHTIEDSGMKLAFASQYNRHFRDRSFVALSEDSRNSIRSTIPVGLCVEGIRVQFSSPGFASRTGILSIADCTGLSAPKTNVSRSALEENNSRQQFQEKIFSLYFKYTLSEINRLQTEEGFSMAYAVEQFPFIAGVLLHAPTDENARKEILRNFPLFIVELENSRKQISAVELIDKGDFWTIESQTLFSLMSLLRDTKASVTSRQVSEFCSFRGPPLPEGSILTNASSSSVARNILESEFEICELHASETGRRLDARWRAISDKKCWISGADMQKSISISSRQQLERAVGNRNRRRPQVYQRTVIATSDIVVKGLEKYFAVVIGQKIYIFPGTPVHEIMSKIAKSENVNDVIKFAALCESLFNPVDYISGVRGPVIQEAEIYLREFTSRYDTEKNIEVEEFINALQVSRDRLNFFNPFAWERSDDGARDIMDF